MKKILLLILLIQTVGYSQSLVINELMTANKTTLYDEDNDTPDWVEIYNTGSAPVNLLNWSLTDDSTEIIKWIFPQKTLNAGEFLIVFISDKNRTEPNLHTSFGLKAAQDHLYLYDPSGNKIDQHFPICIPQGYSYGRKPDGGAFSHLTNPTPGTSNNNSNTIGVSPINDTLIFSHDGGYYTNQISLDLNTNNSSTIIYYTKDGSEPDENSLVYTSTLSLANRTLEINDVSDERTSPEWRKPEENVFKGTVIRAVAFNQGCPVSNVITNTYLIDENIYLKYRFPVISISTDRSNFFGNNKGIYKPGPIGGAESNYNQSGEDWERPVHLEYFKPDGKLAFEYELGARIHGRGSRERPQKSMRFYTGNEYGTDSIEYKLFPDKDITAFKRFILRTPAADISNTLFKDEIAHTLVKNMNMDYQAHQPVIVFINGEYWGIHNMRERQDKHYILNNYGYDPENLTILGLSLDGDEEIEGSPAEYNAMIAFIENNDLSIDANYQAIAAQIDINNYIDYNIAHLFLGDYDWPRNNVRYWKKNDTDGKWRWLFFDCDYCFIQDMNRHLYLFNVGKDETYEKATFLMRSLLKNKNFREQFVQKFMFHLNSTFEPGKVISTIESFRAAYAPMIPEHIARWNTPPTYVNWNEYVDQLKTFAVLRPIEMLKQLLDVYGNPFTVYPNPASDKLNVNIYMEDETDITVRIFDSYGRTISTNSYMNSTSASTNAIDISNLTKGMYFLQIGYGGMLFTNKFIVQ